MAPSRAMGFKAAGAKVTSSKGSSHSKHSVPPPPTPHAIIPLFGSSVLLDSREALAVAVVMGFCCVGLCRFILVCCARRSARRRELDGGGAEGKGAAGSEVRDRAAQEQERQDILAEVYGAGSPQGDDPLDDPTLGVGREGGSDSEEDAALTRAWQAIQRQNSDSDFDLEDAGKLCLDEDEDDRVFPDPLGLRAKVAQSSPNGAASSADGANNSGGGGGANGVGVGGGGGGGGGQPPDLLDGFFTVASTNSAEASPQAAASGSEDMLGLGSGGGGSASGAGSSSLMDDGLERRTRPAPAPQHPRLPPISVASKPQPMDLL